LKKKDGKDINSNLEKIKEYIKKLNETNDFMEFKKKCEDLTQDIYNDETYLEKIKKNWKFILGGILSGLGAVALGVLLVLHFIPGVNFVLTTAELVLVILGIVTAVVSTITNIVIGTTKLSRLRSDIQKLADKLKEFDKNKDEINNVLKTVYGLDDVVIADLVHVIPELKNACEMYLKLVNQILKMV